jgi:hypothetical protein
VVQSDKPFFCEPLFTRDPRLIKPVHILMAMMAIRGIYERHNVQSLNHGIGFNTAAIELILPTYGEQLGLKGKICKHWTLNPHPTLIPAIESGWVEACTASAANWAWKTTWPRGPMCSSPARTAACVPTALLPAGRPVRGGPVHRLHAADRWRRPFVDRHAAACPALAARRTWATTRRPPPRHAGLAGPDRDRRPLARGRKLVVQMVETFQAGGKPTFVESMDAVQVAKDSGMPLAPVMIYGDDVTHVLTEEGIAYLYKARSLEERRRMIAAVAGVTPIGMRHDPATTRQMRSDGLIALPEDLGVHRAQATRSLLAAKSMADLVEWSGGLYNPPRASGAGDGAPAPLHAKRRHRRPADAIGDLAVAVLIDEATLAQTRTGRRARQRQPSGHVAATDDRFRAQPARRLRGDGARRPAGRRIDGAARALGALGRERRARCCAPRAASTRIAARSGPWPAGRCCRLARQHAQRVRGAHGWRDRAHAGPASACAHRQQGRMGARRYGVGGAREQAEAGFPHVTGVGLPMLRAAARAATPNPPRGQRAARHHGAARRYLRAGARGLAGLADVQAGAEAVLDAGGIGTLAGAAACTTRGHDAAHQASPGGAADLLAATLFLDRRAVGEP